MKEPSITHSPAVAAVAMVLGALAVSAVSCQEQTPVAPDGVVTQAAKGGGGGPGPKVTGTDPAGAPPDTSLPVRVFGSNFDDGSTVELTLGGTATPKVTTNSTQFVSSSELIADVTIAADADEALYDVEVQATKGKKGIGVELFAVQTQGGGGNSGGGLQEPIRVVLTGDVISDGRLESFRDPATDSEHDLRTNANLLAGTGTGGPVATSFGVIADLNTCVGDVDDPRAGDVLLAMNAPTHSGSGHGVSVHYADLGEQSQSHATGATFVTTFGSLTGDFIVKIRECPGKVQCPRAWGDPIATVVAGPTTNAMGEISTTYRFTGGQVTVWYRGGGPGNKNSLFIACQFTAGHYVDAEVIENAVTP